jgi:hypothetical protein
MKSGFSEPLNFISSRIQRFFYNAKIIKFFIIDKKKRANFTTDGVGRSILGFGYWQCHIFKNLIIMFVYELNIFQEIGT